MKPICGEFFKEGALSLDRLIEERATPCEYPYFQSSVLFQKVHYVQETQNDCNDPKPMEPTPGKKHKSTAKAK